MGIKTFPPSRDKEKYLKISLMQKYFELKTFTVSNFKSMLASNLPLIRPWTFPPLPLNSNKCPYITSDFKVSILILLNFKSMHDNRAHTFKV
jgi:hypothetical protein